MHFSPITTLLFLLPLATAKKLFWEEPKDTTPWYKAWHSSSSSSSSSAVAPTRSSAGFPTKMTVAATAVVEEEVVPLSAATTKAKTKTMTRRGRIGPR
ncbi:hypothetical protein NX059_007846 [Plenodomus lindquistii]|nr:hypothetical protein NX059_007846 [Plenodomus lindquistii]